MALPKFKVGDVCRVKDYSTLADEKGAVVDADCDILLRTSTGEAWYFWYDERAIATTPVMMGVGFSKHFLSRIYHLLILLTSQEDFPTSLGR